MSKTLLMMFASLVLMGICVWVMYAGESSPSREKPTIITGDDTSPPVTMREISGELIVFCAASNQAVMESIRREYELETGRSVTTQYGGSQTLLAQLELSGQGDLYLPADDSYLALAKEKGLLDAVFPIAKMRCGAAVRKGNPLKVKGLASLISSEVRLVQANPETAAIGKLTRQALLDTGQWQPLAEATEAFRGTVIEVVNDIVVGAADVGIVYDAALHSYPDLEFIPIAELQGAHSQVSVGVLKSSANPSAALDFARFITSTNGGLQQYAKHGFWVK
ncbi:substrate-binding domain-containing protein [Planctomycetaceae bacterium SH139]